MSAGAVAAARSAGGAGAARFWSALLLTWLVVFALVRLPAVELGLLVPWAAAQQQLAQALTGAPGTPTRADASCSGADALGLVIGLFIAYPAPARARLLGGAAVALLLVVLNVLRIAALGHAAGSPARFDLLHAWLWPALLGSCAVASFLAWTRSVEAREGAVIRAIPRLGAFAGWLAVALLAFAATAPIYLGSAALSMAAEAVASAGAAVLALLGAEAAAEGSFLVTARGSFQVTAECLATPLLPVAAAAILAAPIGRRARAGGLLALPVLFALLGVARLLVVAAPSALVPSPEVAVHAFFQLFLAAAAVAGSAFRSRGEGERPFVCIARTALALGGGAAVLALGARPFFDTAAALAGLDRGAIPDPQGALGLLAGAQVALLVALRIVAFREVSWTRIGVSSGLLVLLVPPLLLLASRHPGALASRAGVTAVRAWAIAAPLLAAGLLARAARRPAGGRGFWEHVGSRFPDLGGAPSTAAYLASEQRLFREMIPDLRDVRLLKTDLWDEARNTRILAWAAGEGAIPFGVDLAFPTASRARGAFAGEPLQAAVGDVRALPFVDGSIDAVYSMGTVEHFADSEGALREVHRVLRPGGLALVGVPNRLDPFLRPLLVSVLQALGLYAYGEERSFTRSGLRRMLERSGFDVVAESGVLFLPGGLRMIDLAAHAWFRPGTRLTAPVVSFFAALERRVPALRRHGYLLATLGRKRGDA